MIQRLLEEARKIVQDNEGENVVESKEPKETEGTNENEVQGFSILDQVGDEKTKKGEEFSVEFFRKRRRRARELLKAIGST